MEALNYNLKVKTFADGSQRMQKSSNVYHRMGDEERLQKALFDAYCDSLWDECGCSLNSLPSLEAYLAEREQKQGHTVERKEKENRKRAIQKIYDIARSNVFDYFVAFTFDPVKVDSYDYDSCCRALSSWLDVMRKRGVLWLVVPEQHKKGRWHFHALIKGELELDPAINPHTGELIYDDLGNQIFNLGEYDWGHTTASRIRDPQRTASYLTKYVTKSFDVPKGKQRYWASKKLKRPEETFLMVSDEDFAAYVDDKEHCRFFKDCSNAYGRFMIAEIDAK